MSDQNIEHAIRTATVPIVSNESEEVNALGHRGILLNKSQVQNWSGPVSINQYRLNDDPNPEVITKVSSQPVEYNQDIQVKYLRPPTPAPHGDIIIKELPVILSFCFKKDCLVYILTFGWLKLKKSIVSFSQLFIQQHRH